MSWCSERSRQFNESGFSKGTPLDKLSREIIGDDFQNIYIPTLLATTNEMKASENGARQRTPAPPASN
ncbi:MAG TPA: hypothetical protein V6D48_05510 [Oculatellaceae cyanobacterium]